jgi:hypothetical protein
MTVTSEGTSSRVLVPLAYLGLLHSSGLPGGLFSACALPLPSLSPDELPFAGGEVPEIS